MAEPEELTPPWMVLEAAGKEPIPPSSQTPRDKLHTPDRRDQAQRRDPGWEAIRTAFEAERMRVETEIGSEEPELVVVIEVALSVGAFLEKVENIEGLEFLFEDADERIPDEDFYKLRKRKGASEYSRSESTTLASTVYFVFTDAAAVAQLLSMWNRFKTDPSKPLPRPWKDVFTQQVVDVRPWGPQDRLTESLTNAVEAAEWAHVEFMSLEVELWYRRDSAARADASDRVQEQVLASGGQVRNECVIDGIDYHALLVELPVGEVQSFFAEDPAGLVAARQVMHLHRNTQGSVRRLHSDGESPAVTIDAPTPTGTPRVALLDGLPMSNHDLLSGRLLIDDPEGLEHHYEVKHRCHGTAMASVIIHGDLSAPRDALRRPLYVRPILEWPDNDESHERFPRAELVCDVIHRAIVRMCDGQEGSPPAAPTVKIVNLSIGDPERQFARRVSPLARLLDYLANRYNLLFIVSAGNHSHSIKYRPQTGNLNEDIRLAISNDLLDRRLLAPAESVNSLTVGASNSDRSNTVAADTNRVEPADLGSPALYSAVGRGFRRSVKPEVLAPGGRQLYTEMFDHGHPERELRPVPNVSVGPGVLVAQPGLAGSSVSAEFWRGTSLATGHVTRFASDVLDRLETLQAERGDEAIPEESLPILTKALVVHASSWGEPTKWEADAGLRGSARRAGMSRLSGYGKVSPNWLFADAPHRATLIATDVLDVDEQVFFEIPLPQGLRSSTHWRRLRLTLAWFSPINPKHQRYRRAALALEIPKASRNLLEIDRAEVHNDAAVRGTVQHELLEGTDAPIFSDGDRFGVTVSCKAGAGNLVGEVRFGLAATLEVGLEANIAIREQMRERVRLRS